MNTKIDRDEIKSQLKEGLKHTKKILRNKKEKKNEDLILTLGTKQFLINRCYLSQILRFFTHFCYLIGHIVLPFKP